ncbi:MAG TPA: nuclear transport factor 2 family protein [Sphingobium sp.]|nr:nuclear transport factor 2 family protein [Sphingobium sp.]
MRNVSSRRIGTWLGAASVAASLVLAVPAAQAQNLTPQILVERAEILDQITRFYYNILNPDPQSFAEFFTDDGELILGVRSLKGKEQIASAYVRGSDNFNANAFSFNILVGNPLITVKGNTATSKVTFTEVLLEKDGGLPRIVVSAREYATWEKVGGKWLYKKRNIFAGTKPPAWWTE